MIVLFTTVTARVPERSTFLCGSNLFEVMGGGARNCHARLSPMQSEGAADAVVGTGTSTSTYSVSVVRKWCAQTFDFTPNICITI